MNRAILSGIVAASAGLGAAGAQAQNRPGTGPWDVKALQKTPEFVVGDSQTLKEGDRAVLLSTIHYAGEPWLGKPTRIFAYYARPVDLPEKKIPAIVLVHGGGGTAFPQWARLWAARGYAALAMDLSGSGADRKRLTDGGPDQDHESKFRRLKDGVKNSWSYHAVAAVIRGTSVLRAMPDVDPRRVAITGISWGGYLTTIAMSLDDRLKAAVPVYGCGFLHENSVWVPILNGLPEDERRIWVENFDPSRYLARCRIPVLWVNGTNDAAYPLDSYQKSYLATKSPPTLCVTVNMPHGHEAGWARHEIHLFVDGFFRTRELAQPLAAVGPPVVDDKTVRVGYSGPSAIQRAELHWTSDTDKPWPQRAWATARGEVLGLDLAQAELPAARPLIFFLTLTDVRGAVVSTRHMSLPAAAK